MHITTADLKKVKAFVKFMASDAANNVELELDTQVTVAYVIESIGVEEFEKKFKTLEANCTEEGFSDFCLDIVHIVAEHIVHDSQDTVSSLEYEFIAKQGIKLAEAEMQLYGFVSHPNYILIMKELVPDWFYYLKLEQDKNVVRLAGIVEENKELQRLKNKFRKRLRRNDRKSFDNFFKIALIVCKDIKMNLFSKIDIFTIAMISDSIDNLSDEEIKSLFTETEKTNEDIVYYASVISDCTIKNDSINIFLNMVPIWAFQYCESEFKKRLYETISECSECVL